MHLSVFTIRRVLSRAPQADPPADVVYVLSDDYSVVLQLRQRFGSRAEVRTAAGIFHRKVRELKTPFLELCRTAERHNAPEVYWRTHFASRNSATLPFLKHLAYLACADELIATGTAASLAIVVASPVLARTIAAHARARGHSASVHRTLLDQGNARRALGMAVKSIAVLARLLGDWLQVRRARLPRLPQHAGVRWTCLRSWVTAGSVEAAATVTVPVYRDRNFGALPDYLRSQGRHVVVWPMLFNLRGRTIDTLADLARTDQPFLFQEQYLHLTDYVGAYLAAWRETAIRLDGLEWQATSLSALAREAHWSSCFSLSLMTLHLCEPTLARLRASGVEFESFLYPIENNAPEKVFVRTIRRLFPHARVRGFQHGVWYKEQFGMSLLPGEAATHPVPDEILCSGRRYLEVLAGEHFPADRLTLAANVRYVEVHGESMRPRARKRGVPSLLVILNFDWNQAREVLGELAQVLPTLPEVVVRIKPHPLLNELKLRQYLTEIGLDGTEIAAGRVRELAQASDCVLMTGGSVSNLEVLAAGVPLVLFSLANDFDFNCIWDKNALFEVAGSREALTAHLRLVLERPEEARRRYEERAPAIVRDYFEPVDASTLAAFL